MKDSMPLLLVHVLRALQILKAVPKVAALLQLVVANRDIILMVDYVIHVNQTVNYALI